MKNSYAHWLLVFSLSFTVLSAADTPAPFSAPPAEATVTAALPLVAVQGNRFVNPAGQTVVFRGLAFSDPVELLRKGKWSRRHFEEAKKWNANVVRIPVHPAEWRRLGEDAYLKMLDEAVQWSGELGMYVIIDWHTIGNLLTGVYHRPAYVTSRDETFRFWYAITQRFKNNPVVALYELYNEPTNVDGEMGPMPWDEYRKLIEDLTYMIQKINPRAIVLVAGYNWGYDLTQVRYEPIRAANVAYVTHPYPQKRPENWELNWQRDWGFVADKYPMVATELGFMDAKDRGAHRPVIGDEKYGEAIIAFFEKRGISWTPWVFDAEWAPMLINDWDYTPTREGVFFREKMRELNR
ncbi:MAG TPA: cellulase family glycosylhydrolase [Lacunisphaera sp.]